MIYSMTAFARKQEQGEWGNLVCEIRSINHRYLEISVHLPDNLRVLEMPIRELFRQHIKRGKIECAVRYKSNVAKENALFSLNADLAKSLCEASEEIAPFLKNPGKVSPFDILRYPGVLETKETDVNQLHNIVLQLVKESINDLLSARAREGEELSQLFFQRMVLIQQELGKVRGRLPTVLQEQRDKMHKRFNEAKLELDLGRLEQEMLIFAQRSDVAEEIDRTETHLIEVKRILNEGGLAGRRLDFLLQELNREANTLGSKSADTILTHAAVEMKVLIEQMREQVQNIE